MIQTTLVLRRTDHTYDLYRHDLWLSKLRGEGLEALGDALHSGTLKLRPGGHELAVKIRRFGHIATKRQVDLLVTEVVGSGKTTFMLDHLYVVHLVRDNELTFNAVFAANMAPTGPFVHMLPAFIAAGALEFTA